MTGLAHRIARIGTLIVLITCLGCIEHSDPLQAGAVRDSGTANTPENGKDTGIWNDTGDTAPPGCSAILDTSDWELCATGPSYCAAVFDDAAGCLAVCEAVGLECSAVYENVDGECAPDETRPALSCNPPSGHQSDYCVCSGEPEVGNDEPPESEEDECDGYPYSADTLWAERAGYGAAATGGDPDNIYHVTTLADGGSGSLRAALESDQDYWIVFDVEGGITHIDPVRITSNKTVDGRGRSITVEGELRLEDAENVILSDLSLTNQLEEPCGQDGDVISIRGTGGGSPSDFSSRNIWIHHVELYEGGDGLLDIRGGTDITLSWSHLHSHMKAMLNSYDVDGATTEGM